MPIQANKIIQTHNMATAAQKKNIARFKAVQAEAKKLKAKNKSLSHIQAVKQAWVILYSKDKKAAPKKKTAKKKIGQYDLFGEKTIAKKKIVKKKAAVKKAAVKKAAPKKLKYVGVKKTASGASRYEYKLGSIDGKMMVRISPIAYVYASNYITKSTMGLREYLKNNVGKYIEIDTNYLFNNQYNTVSGYRIYDTMIDLIKNDHREKGKGYGVNNEVEDIAFLDWGGVKPNILPNIPEKKFGSYYFESYPELNYHRLRNARQTINFIYSNGKYYISNGIGYKVANKLRSTYLSNSLPADISTKVDKYIKQYY